LTKSAGEISVYDVYRAFEPELTLVIVHAPETNVKKLIFAQPKIIGLN